jgi:hypothetical protein
VGAGRKKASQEADMIHWWKVLAQGMDGRLDIDGRTDGQTVATLSAGDLIECSTG